MRKKKIPLSTDKIHRIHHMDFMCFLWIPKYFPLDYFLSFKEPFLASWLPRNSIDFAVFCILVHLRNLNILELGGGEDS